MQPVLIINGHDYAPWVESLELTENDLDAEGSGRDVQTGEMFRTRVAIKLKASVKLLRLEQPMMQRLRNDLGAAYYDATVLNPATGAQVTKTFYTATRPFGAQRYNRATGAPCYDGVAFEMVEK